MQYKIYLFGEQQIDKTNFIKKLFNKSISTSLYPTIISHLSNISDDCVYIVSNNTVLVNIDYNKHSLISVEGSDNYFDDIQVIDIPPLCGIDINENISMAFIFVSNINLYTDYWKILVDKIINNTPNYTKIFIYCNKLDNEKNDLDYISKNIKNYCDKISKKIFSHKTSFSEIWNAIATEYDNYYTNKDTFISEKNKVSNKHTLKWFDDYIRNKQIVDPEIPKNMFKLMDKERKELINQCRVIAGLTSVGIGICSGLAVGIFNNVLGIYTCMISGAISFSIGVTIIDIYYPIDDSRKYCVETFNSVYEDELEGYFIYKGGKYKYVVYATFCKTNIVNIINVELKKCY